MNAMRVRALAALPLLAALLATVLPAAPARADVPIVLDSNFGDWVGQSFISDPFDDSDDDAGRDVHEFYWANNIDEEYNYWMISRYTTDGQPFDGDNGQKKKVLYYIRIDTNDNGGFDDEGDRIVSVEYDPKPTEGKTEVKVGSPADKKWLYESKKQDWGDTEGEGGLRTEFRVAWTDLNVSFGQPTRMYVESIDKDDADDRAPDSGDIQWSPASILGPWVLAAAAAAGFLAIWYFKGRHTWRRG